MRSRAFTVLSASPVTTAFSLQSSSSTTACMNSSLTRTELFAFWYWIECESMPSRSMSKPASRSARALRSSSALHQMNSSRSGWSASRMTILAARRVLPPELCVTTELHEILVDIVHREVVGRSLAGLAPSRPSGRSRHRSTNLAERGPATAQGTGRRAHARGTGSSSSASAQRQYGESARRKRWSAVDFQTRSQLLRDVRQDPLRLERRSHPSAPPQRRARRCLRSETKPTSLANRRTPSPPTMRTTWTGRLPYAARRSSMRPIVEGIPTDRQQTMHVAGEVSNSPSRAADTHCRHAHQPRTDRRGMPREPKPGSS